LTQTWECLRDLPTIPADKLPRISNSCTTFVTPFEPVSGNSETLPSVGGKLRYQRDT
jgi:hypothetical protein